MAYILEYDKYSGITGLAGEALAECDLATLDSNGKLVKADADALGLKRPAGIVQYACASGDNAVAWSDCVVGGLSGRTRGAPVYGSTVAGAFSETPPSTFGAPTIQIGHTLATDKVRFRIEQYGRPPKRLLCFFVQDPIIAARLGAGAATGTAGDRNQWLFPGMGDVPGVQFEATVIGTQTIVAPALTAVGMDLGSQDQTAGDGVECTHGITARNPLAFVVGTDGACYVKATFKVEDASGVNPLLVGFRKVEAHQAVYTGYADYAAIGIIGTANPNTIKTTTEKAGGGNTDTDTTQTWADGETHTLEVYVSAAGVVTYKIDGAAPTVVVAFSFTAGDVIMPFVRFIQAADIAGKVEWSMYDAGQL